MRLHIQTHLAANELQQGSVDGQLLDVRADGGLVERAGLAVQFVQAHFAHGVSAAQADGLAVALLEGLRADGTQQKLGPLRGLHGHCSKERSVMHRSPRSSLIAAFVSMCVFGKAIRC